MKMADLIKADLRVDDVNLDAMLATMFISVEAMAAADQATEKRSAYAGAYVMALLHVKEHGLPDELKEEPLAEVVRRYNASDLHILAPHEHLGAGT